MGFRFLCCFAFLWGFPSLVPACNGQYREIRRSPSSQSEILSAVGHPEVFASGPAWQHITQRGMGSANEAVLVPYVWVTPLVNQGWCCPSGVMNAQLGQWTAEGKEVADSRRGVGVFLGFWGLCRSGRMEETCMKHDWTFQTERGKKDRKQEKDTI